MRVPLVFCVVLIVAMMGCGSPGGPRGGGNGTNFYAPNTLVAGQETTVGMSFAAPAGGSGELSQRYTNIVLHYALSDETPPGTVKVRVVSSDEKYMSVAFRVPAFTPRSDNVTVQFSVSFLLDGHENTTNGGTVPITKPKPRQPAAK